MDFASKLIAREIVRYESEKRGIEVRCSNSLVVFDRDQGAREAAEKEGMRLHSLIGFRSRALDWLQAEMQPGEHTLILDYLENPGKYQDKEVQKEVIKKAKRNRETK